MFEELINNLPTGTEYNTDPTHGMIYVDFNECKREDFCAFLEMYRSVLDEDKIERYKVYMYVLATLPKGINIDHVTDEIDRLVDGFGEEIAYYIKDLQED